MNGCRLACIDGGSTGGGGGILSVVAAATSAVAVAVVRAFASLRLFDCEDELMAAEAVFVDEEALATGATMSSSPLEALVSHERSLLETEVNRRCIFVTCAGNDERMLREN